MICSFLKSRLFQHYFEIFTSSVLFWVVIFSTKWFGMESWLLFLYHGTEIRVHFSSSERFETEFRELASSFVPRNGIPSCYLFRGRVRNGTPRFSVPRKTRNSVGNNHLFRLFRLPRNYFFVGNSQPYYHILVSRHFNLKFRDEGTIPSSYSIQERLYRKLPYLNIKIKKILDVEVPPVIFVLWKRIINNGIIREPLHMANSTLATEEWVIKVSKNLFVFNF